LWYHRKICLSSLVQRCGARASSPSSLLMLLECRQRRSSPAVQPSALPVRSAHASGESCATVPLKSCIAHLCLCSAELLSRCPCTGCSLALLDLEALLAGFVRLCVVPAFLALLFFDLLSMSDPLEFVRLSVGLCFPFQVDDNITALRHVRRSHTRRAAWQRTAGNVALLLVLFVLTLWQWIFNVLLAFLQ